MKKFYPSIIFIIILLAFTFTSNAMDRGSGSGDVIASAPMHHRLLAEDRKGTMPNNYLFGVETSSNKVFSCSIKISSANPKRCREQNLGGIPASHIAVAPYGSYVYVTSTIVDNNNIYMCHINVATGDLEHCGPIEVNINFPRQIAIDTSGSFMYVRAMGHSIFYCSINQDTGIPHDCKVVENDFNRGIDGMYISPNHTYFYLTFSGSPAITICKINRDFTFSNCTPNEDPLYRRPSEVYAEPSGRYVYIADFSKEYAVVCKSPQGRDERPTFQGCTRANEVFPDRSRYVSIAIHPTGHLAYFGGITSSISTCVIDYSDGGKLVDCKSKSSAKLGLGQRYIRSLSFR